MTVTERKERPIIFSGEMVHAILGGRKTQTRRVVKPQFNTLFGAGVTNSWPDKYSINVDIHNHDGTWKWLHCPYGRAGDLLYVREAHQLDPPQDGSWNYHLFDDGSGSQNIGAIPERFRNPGHVIYRADGDHDGLRWRPSIYMPKWAARIWLEVMDVGVERVQRITEADAKAEGISPLAFWPDPHRSQFETLWNDINASRGYGWDENPWVWVVEFRQVEL